MLSASNRDMMLGALAWTLQKPHLRVPAQVTGLHRLLNVPQPWHLTRLLNPRMNTTRKQRLRAHHPSSWVRLGPTCRVLVISNIYNPYPGPCHPDYLSQNFQPPPYALPFFERRDFGGRGKYQRTTKRRRMSMDSASEPP